MSDQQPSEAALELVSGSRKFLHWSHFAAAIDAFAAEQRKGYIRREVADRLGLRHPPELVFELDKSQQYETRIEQLLHRVEKRKR